MEIPYSVDRQWCLEPIHTLLLSRSIPLDLSHPIPFYWVNPYSHWRSTLLLFSVCSLLCWTGSSWFMGHLVWAASKGYLIFAKTSQYFCSRHLKCFVLNTLCSKTKHRRHLKRGFEWLELLGFTVLVYILWLVHCTRSMCFVFLLKLVTNVPYGHSHLATSWPQTQDPLSFSKLG